MCFLDLLVNFEGLEMRWKMDSDILSDCQPAVWLDVAGEFPSFYVHQGVRERVLYNLVHKNVSHNMGCPDMQRIDHYTVPFLQSVQCRLQKVEARNLKALGSPMARSCGIDTMELIGHPARPIQRQKSSHLTPTDEPAR